MKKTIQIHLSFFILFLIPIALWSAEDKVAIDSIYIVGNKKTKTDLITRELDFAIGDSILIGEIGNIFERNRLFILNTGMFNTVKLNIDIWNEKEKKISVKIEVKEIWFFYPVPVLELADRDFNVWWKEFNLSLKRLNFGLRVYHLNLTGNRDRLKVAFQTGFSQKYDLRYSYPFLNKAQTLGFTAKAFFARSKEIGYKTEGNKLLFFRDENDFLLKRVRASFSLNYRPKLFEYHNLEIAYRKYSTGNYVQQELNPNFFLNGDNSQQYFYIDYEFIFDRRDIKPYPMHGYQITASIRKEGLGIFGERNGLYSLVAFDKYFSFSKRWSLELKTKAKVSFIRNWHPFNNYNALGYGGDFIRGYELYVMDGLDYFYLKSSFRIKIVERVFQLNRMMPIKAFKVMPLKIYITINNDTAYINDPQLGEINPLGNKCLWGGGIGLNFVLYYDKVIRLEYSFNQLNERGLFFQYTLSL